MKYIKNAMLNTSAWMMTLVLFLLLTSSACQSLPGGSLNIPYPERPVNPGLEFKNDGDHCVTDKEFRRLAAFYIDAKSYFDETELIIDAVNGK